MRRLQLIIEYWSRTTFPEQSADRLYKHLQEEMGELADALADDTMEPVQEEIADCLILLLCLASYCEIDALDAVERKHAINTQRVYQFDPALGYDRKVETS